MTESKTTRRTFMKQSTAAAVAASASAGFRLAPGAYAAGSDQLRLGFVGCGGRGTGAVVNALNADKNIKLVAMGDAFKERLDASLTNLKNTDVAEKVDVPEDRQYTGFDAYKNVLDQVDVAVLTSTPHFRPRHLKYAVEKGVHVFAEKPVATDAPGVREILAATEVAKTKGISIVSGLCWRYHNPRVETMKRVSAGDIGDIVAIQTVYNSGGVWPPRKRRDEVDSDMAYQIWNWYYYTWLSGDHINEQAIHGIDTMGWAMGDEPPVQCWGTGGRQVRTDPIYGNIFDHFSIVYEYANGVRGYHTCRHWKGAETMVQDHILGSKGACNVFGNSITGEKPWKYEGESCDMYQNEHDKLFAAIRSGEPINNGEYMAKSTMLAIMGRTAAYTGQIITWDQMMKSEEKLGPDKYEWGYAPQDPVAIPGKTKFV